MTTGMRSTAVTMFSFSLPPVPLAHFEQLFFADSTFVAHCGSCLRNENIRSNFFSCFFFVLERAKAMKFVVLFTIEVRLKWRKSSRTRVQCLRVAFELPNDVYFLVVATQHEAIWLEYGVTIASTPSLPFNWLWAHTRRPCAFWRLCVRACAQCVVSVAPKAFSRNKWFRIHGIDRTQRLILKTYSCSCSAIFCFCCCRCEAIVACVVYIFFICSDFDRNILESTNTGRRHANTETYTIVFVVPLWNVECKFHRYRLQVETDHSIGLLDVGNAAEELWIVVKFKCVAGDFHILRAVICDYILLR